MFLLVKDVLSAEELDQVRKLARSVRFIDGRASNPHNLAKENLQADISQAEAQRASQIAGAAIARNEEIKNFAFPRRMATPLLSRYEPSMKYGVHSDSAFIPLPTSPLRSDVSGTLFLEDPSTYDGGELVVHLGTETIRVKGNPGEMIIYPSTTLHEVMPVTRGARLALFTFMESMVPDQSQRELLYILNEVNALEGFNISWENRTRLNHISASLYRMWSR